METWVIRQWQRNTPWQILLRPISWLFLLLVAIRRAAYAWGLRGSTSVAVPVVIVGNITVGGTGKTPLVLALVDALAKRGRHCGIVTRGYQRRNNESLANVIHVVPAQANSGVVIDEATLLAQRSGAPVYAGIDRVAAAETLLRNCPEVDVIICDDGLQHYALRRDVEICVIDGARGLGNGALLPAGPLREPASRLDTVAAIVVNGGGSGSRDFPACDHVFEMVLANEIFVNLMTDARLSVSEALAEFSGKRTSALAGTGNPDRFFSHLAKLGITPDSTKSFPDHHPYQASDMPGKEVEIILMTEKDAVKCCSFADDRMGFMRVDAVLPNAFIDFVSKKLTDRKI
ncbi:MAG: tetraacyldisaccharide 4'-kinase [Usitatibacteraceae bacterium]